MIVPPFYRGHMRPGTDPAVKRAVSDLRGGGAGGDLVFESRAGGVYVADTGLYAHWARIGFIREANRYEHREIFPNGDGTYYDPIAQYPGNAQEFTHGFPERIPACEVNGDENVPEGLIVWLVPARFAAAYDFTTAGAPQSGGGKSGSGGGGADLVTVCFNVTEPVGITAVCNEDETITVTLTTQTKRVCITAVDASISETVL